MTILPQFSRSLARMASVLLPQDCMLCGAFTGPSLLCPGCVADLPTLPMSQCPVCALPTPRGETCGACLKQAPHFDATWARFRYGLPLDRLVHALKYQHRTAVTQFFSLSLLDMAAVTKMSADLIIPLPLSKQRMAERGFNQSMEIARPLARHLGLPLNGTGCVRSLHTVSQASLPWKERQKNIRGAFECRLDLSGQHVIVIDDVMTTGATLNEFARTLKKHGAARVSNWVVARTLRD